MFEFAVERRQLTAAEEAQENRKTVVAVVVVLGLFVAFLGVVAAMVYYF